MVEEAGYPLYMPSRTTLLSYKVIPEGVATPSFFFELFIPIVLRFVQVLSLALSSREPTYLVVHDDMYHEANEEAKL